jgi:hypothetical protein
MANMIKGFVLLMGQILKKIIIAAIVLSLCYAGWTVFKRFTKDTSKRAKATGEKRMEKQGLKVEK